MRIVPASPDSVICTVHLIKYYILISWTPGLCASVWGFCIFYFLYLGSFEGFFLHIFSSCLFCLPCLLFSLFARTSHFILVVCSSVCLTSFILFLLISCTCLFTHLFPIPLISLCIFIATDIALSLSHNAVVCPVCSLSVEGFNLLFSFHGFWGSGLCFQPR